MLKKKSIARAITYFTPPELRSMLAQARKAARFPEDSVTPLDIRLVKTKGPLSRILIIVSKKCGSAPQRNLFKRRLKALFYEHRLYKQPFSLVIYCKQGGTLLSYKDLEQFLYSALGLPYSSTTVEVSHVDNYASNPNKHS